MIWHVEKYFIEVKKWLVTVIVSYSSERRKVCQWCPDYIYLLNVSIGIICMKS